MNIQALEKRVARLSPKNLILTCEDSDGAQVKLSVQSYTNAPWGTFKVQNIRGSNLVDLDEYLRFEFESIIAAAEGVTAT